MTFRHRPSASECVPGGVQFHVEVDRAGVEAWLRVAEASLPRVWQRQADEVRAELDEYLDAQQMNARRLFGSFALAVGASADGRQ